MKSRDRVLGALNRTGYDCIPVKHEGTPEINQMIMDHYGLTNMEQLLRVVGDDFRYVEPVYTGPELRTFDDGSIEGYGGEHYRYAIQVGSPLEHIIALYKTSGSLNEVIDKSVTSTSEGKMSDDINISKLF